MEKMKKRRLENVYYCNNQYTLTSLTLTEEIVTANLFKQNSTTDHVF